MFWICLERLLQSCEQNRSLYGTLAVGQVIMQSNPLGYRFRSLPVADFLGQVSDVQGTAARSLPFSMRDAPWRGTITLSKRELSFFWVSLRARAVAGSS